jgi:CRP-like cAMP-binding protein
MTRAPKAEHRTNWLLAALEPEDFAALEPHLEVVELPLKQVLYETGDPIRHAYFPHHAVVSLVNVLEDGNMVEVALFGRGGVVGLLSALVSREAFGRYVVQMAGTASRIAVETLNEVRNAHPKMQQLIASYGEVLLAQTFQILTCNAVHPVEARCCRWILMMHDRAEQDTLPLTHEFLAEMLGVQRSTVSDPTGPWEHHGDGPDRSRGDRVRVLRPDPAPLPARDAWPLPTTETGRVNRPSNFA